MLWIERLACDTRLRGLPTSVAVVLALRYLNSKSQVAWPGTERMAGDVGATRRNVQHALDKLVETGYLLRTVVSGGRLAGSKGKTNTYRLGNCVAHDALTAQSSASPTTIKCVVQSKSSASPTTHEPWNRTLEEPKTEKTRDVEGSKEGKNDQSKPTPATDWPDDYRDQFRNTYPRFINARPAFEALDAVKTSGTPWKQLIAAVKGYARDTKDTEKRYIKAPKTWLEKQCWLDDYSPPPPPSPQDWPENWQAKFREIFGSLATDDAIAAAERYRRDGAGWNRVKDCAHSFASKREDARKNKQQFDHTLAGWLSNFDFKPSRPGCLP